MYGHFNSIQPIDQYSNQQYSTSKDDYSIKHTQPQPCRSVQYSVKELHPLNATFSDTGHNLPNNNMQLINTPDQQWPTNNHYYNDQNSYALLPDAIQSSVCNQSTTVQQSNLPSNVPVNIHSSNLPPANLQSPNLPTASIQSNVQLNIQLNVQNNINPIISTSPSSNIKQTVNQFANQIPNHQSNALSNRVLNSSSSSTKSYRTFGEGAPLTKKLKNEKITNFNLNYNQNTSHSQTDYFHNLTPKNQVRQSNATYNQCDLVSYSSNQSTNAVNNFNLSTTELSTTGEFYSIQPQQSTNTINQSTYQPAIKSDQIDYTNLNSLNTLNNLHSLNSLSNQPDAHNTQQQKKLLDNSLKQTALSNQPTIQSSHSVAHSTTSTHPGSAYSINPLDSFTQSTGNSPKSILNCTLKSCLKSSTIVKQELKATIQTRRQKQLPFNTSPLSSLSTSTKLVDRKEVPNCRLIISKTNQNRTKATGVFLNEEEKKRRRRDRNKIAATKCRNKKKAHVVKLNEQSVNLDLENKFLNNELVSLKLEEQRLVQLLFSHRKICNLRFTISTYELDQICHTNQFNNFTVTNSSFVSSNFSQPMIMQPNDNRSLKNINRIKMDDTNQLTNNQFNNQQVVYDPSLDQPNSVIKIEEFNYSNNQMSNLDNQNYQQQQQPPDYNSQSYNSLQVNYGQFNSSTNYGPIIVNKQSNESNSSNLTSVDYLCTNNTPNDGDIVDSNLINSIYV